MVPKNYKKIYSAKKITDTCRRIGADITKWALEIKNDQSQDLLCVPVLRGGLFFFADLVRYVKCSVDIAPVRTWGYEIKSVNQQSLELRIDLGDINIRNRTVLIVDDLCDSGKTMQELKKIFLQHDAKEVKSAVLIQRNKSQNIIKPDWIGFEYAGEEWFVGYGMDDCDRWRNLKDIYIIPR